MMDDTPQQYYVPEILLKLANIDTAYFMFAGFLVVLILEKWNLLDILYFGAVTITYIRIKVHRWKLKRF